MLSTTIERTHVLISVQLEDLFVDEGFRGKGVGKAFFTELAKVAQEKASFCPSHLPNSSYVKLVHAELRTNGLVCAQGWCHVYVSLCSLY